VLAAAKQEAQPRTRASASGHPVKAVLCWDGFKQVAVHRQVSGSGTKGTKARASSMANPGQGAAAGPGSALKSYRAPLADFCFLREYSV
jgi:hypothetical protein